MRPYRDIRVEEKLREAMSLLALFIALGVILSAVNEAFHLFSGTYELKVVADDLSQKLALAGAQADGFKLPFPVDLPNYKVVCDGTTLSVRSGNVTASVRLVRKLSPFEADGGRVWVYPGGEVRVEG
ncbi:MAG: hypothetical protein QXP84_05305 [Candidatus Korarchaeum sp.]